MVCSSIPSSKTHTHTHHMYIYAYCICIGLPSRKIQSKPKKKLPFRTFPVNLSRARTICIEWNHLCGYECKCISETNFRFIFKRTKMLKRKICKGECRRIPGRKLLCISKYGNAISNTSKIQTEKNLIAEWNFSHLKNAHHFKWKLKNYIRDSRRNIIIKIVSLHGDWKRNNEEEKWN